ncbi:hypothetical protein, conserved [Eimeria acervulina]|uniref:Uncharacterized protein n=1 Tax=Eimeria acervulina TaxID=5801 RepID=U6GMA6_EIMAC|nr:hypothetical protein, conserved [Eimeria acervulina]CDI81315.1 hypothetical protein, conserved [Eimeria acervulina]
MQEGQRQRQSKELNFEPAEWAFPTSICDLMFSSCIAHHSPLHEHVEGSADSREDENAAAVNSLQRTLWSDTNLQLACGTRCRSLRRVKDEGRQVWMEYQEVTLRDNSKRFQWVELADNAKAAVQ